MMANGSLLRSGGETWGPVSPHNVHENGLCALHPDGDTIFRVAHQLLSPERGSVEETALHDASNQPHAEPNEARDDDEHGGSDTGGVHNARTLRRGAMRMRSELRLSGHLGPATESECTRNNDPSWDSAPTRLLSSHHDGIDA
jgi:hypothetical protein